MKTNFLLLALLLSSFTLMFSSCEKEPEEPTKENEEEVITTLTFTLTPTNNASAPTVTMQFQDLDGDGGNAPTITGGELADSTTYTGSLTLLNEAETPAEDITAEIREEDKEHQFFFQTDVNGLSVAYTDQDPDGNPIGLSTTITTVQANSGNLTVTLKHEPNKSAAGVAGGDITNAGGETDIEVVFPVEVK